MASQEATQQNTKKEKKPNLASKIGFPIALVVFLLMWFFPIFGEMDLITRHTLALMAFTIICWITRPWMPAISGMLFMVLACLLGLSSTRDAFSGLADTTPWFIWAALVISLAVKDTKLDLRIAYSLLMKIPSTTKSVLGLHIVIAWLLSYIIPSSTARVVTAAPIGAAQIESLGLPLKSQAGKMLFISMVTVNFMVAKCILTGGGTTIAAWGVLRENGIYISWIQWWLYFIVPIIIGMLVLFFGLWIIFRPEKAAISSEETAGKVSGVKEIANNVLNELGPLSVREKRLGIIMAAVILLWATEPLHGLNSDLVGILTGLVLLLPGIGVLNAKEAFRKIGWNTVIFVAAALSIGVVTENTGVAPILSGLLAKVLTFGGSEFMFILMMLVLGFLGRLFLRSGAANVAVLLIPTVTLAASLGYSATLVGLIFPISLAGLFIYQHSFGIIVYDYGTFEEPDFIKASLVRYLAVAVMMAVGYFIWWPITGASAL